MSTVVELRNATAVFTGRAEGDLGRTAGEPSGDVAANRSRLLETLGLRSVVVPAQLHGAGVGVARDAARSQERFAWPPSAAGDAASD